MDDEPPEEEDGVVKLIDEYIEEKTLMKKLQTGIFRSSFLKTNMEWIIKNLDFIIGNNQKSHKYL